MLERCVNKHIKVKQAVKVKSARIKSSVIKRTDTLKFSQFLSDYYGKCCVFSIHEMLFLKFLFERFKYNDS